MIAFVLAVVKFGVRKQRCTVNEPYGYALFAVAVNIVITVGVCHHHHRYVIVLRPSKYDLKHAVSNVFISPDYDCSCCYRQHVFSHRMRVCGSAVN